MIKILFSRKSHFQNNVNNYKYMNDFYQKHGANLASVESSESQLHK